MKFYRVTADYRPNNPDKPTYEFCVNDSVNKSKMKKLFSDLYTGLKVYGVEEVEEDECGKWVDFRFSDTIPKMVRCVETGIVYGNEFYAKRVVPDGYHLEFVE